MAPPETYPFDRRRFAITLIQMPFAPIKQAPLALLQLQAAVVQSAGERVATRIVYPSFDFAKRFGIGLYHQIAYADSNLRSGDMAGLGDWLFRDAAFPGLPDNTPEYCKRYFPASAPSPFLDFDAVLAARTQVIPVLEDVIDRYELHLDDLVGFTSMFCQHTACIALARLLKRTVSAPLIVIGGANCEGPMGQALADSVSYFDAVFSGPGLKSFPAYVRRCLDGDGRGHVAPGIPGVLTGQDSRRPAHSGSSRTFIAMTPTNSGAVSACTLERPIPLTAEFSVPRASAGHCTLGEELDIKTTLQLDYTSFLDTFEQAFGNGVRPVLTFETSRGCWWGAKAHCPFCGLNGSTMSYRALTPHDAIARLEDLFQYTGRCNVFECVDNIMPAEYPETVFSQLNTPPEAVIYYEVKADLSESDLTALAHAGVRLIQPGIEALSTPSLRALRKGTSAMGNVLLLKNCLASGVTPIWNLLIGIPLEEAPREVYAKYARAARLMRHLPPPWAVFRVRIDRFSPYFMEPARYGLKIAPKEFYRFVYPFDHDTLFDLAYYFDDTNAGTAAYAAAAAEWQPILHELIRTWFDAWRDPNVASRPALFVEQRSDRFRLHDSRNGTTTEDDIDETTFRVLEYLSRPARISRLSERLDDLGGIDLAAVLGELRERELLFEEGDRALSLVHMGPRPVRSVPPGCL